MTFTGLPSAPQRTAVGTRNEPTSAKLAGVPVQEPQQISFGRARALPEGYGGLAFTRRARRSKTLATSPGRAASKHGR
jgi:hypothetical protein